MLTRREDANISYRQTGSIGFCAGGGNSFRFATEVPDLNAAVVYYGGTPPEAALANIKAPVLGLYGGKDQGIPLDTVDKMKAALAGGSAAAKASQFVVYPEAGHAFHADYRPSYIKEPAEDGWRRAVAWFKANGVA